MKDFVRDVNRRAPLLGHRAVQFTVLREDVRTEIQIMTSLQHAWDRRNHCFYEWLREGNGGEATLDLRIDDHAVAEAPSGTRPQPSENSVSPTKAICSPAHQ